MNSHEMPTGPKLNHTGAQVMNVLIQEIEKIAKGVEGATEKDITQAAFHLALKAERDGTPYTLESIQEMSENQRTMLSDALGIRIGTHTPNAHRIHITDGKGVVASAESMGGVITITEQEREAM